MNLQCPCLGGRSWSLARKRVREGLVKLLSFRSVLKISLDEGAFIYISSQPSVPLQATRDSRELRSHPSTNLRVTHAPIRPPSLPLPLAFRWNAQVRVIIYRELHALADILDGHKHQIRLLDLSWLIISYGQVRRIMNGPRVRQTSRVAPAYSDCTNGWVFGVSTGILRWA